MEVKVKDTFAQMLLFKRKIEIDPGGAFSFWNEYIDSCAAEIKEKVLQDSRSYDFNNEIKPVFHHTLTAGFDGLNTAHLNFEKVISKVEERFALFFPESHGVAVYFYIGLCNGAGWATSIGKEQCILLGAEKIVELGWYSESALEALICHELCHIAHEELRGGFLSFGAEERAEQAVWQLYIEGFAQRYEQVLAGKEGYYHQNKNNWLEWCEDNKPALAVAYLERILRNERADGFFGDWMSFMGQADTGYFLGCELIRSLEQGYSVNEIACMEYAEIYNCVILFLRKCTEY